jgi:DUF971 family protein
MLSSPQKIEIVGDFLALSWGANNDIIIDSHTLRLHSPSAEQTGETDIFGRLSGKSKPQDLSGVKVISFERVGNYAVRLVFSDGHGSGIYSWEYLNDLDKLHK